MFKATVSTGAKMGNYNCSVLDMSSLIVWLQNLNSAATFLFFGFVSYGNSLDLGGWIVLFGLAAATDLDADAETRILQRTFLFVVGEVATDVASATLVPAGNSFGGTLTISFSNCA